MKTNATIPELNQALSQVNNTFEDNIRFKRIEQSGSKVLFTLTVVNSRLPGGRLSHTGRRIAAACWHVHGHFFDCLFKINPGAWVKSLDKTITKNAGNWQDWQIGSQARPVMYSDACECDHHLQFHLAKYDSYSN